MWSKISKRKLNIPLLVGTILCGLFVGFNIHGTKMPRQMSIIQELQGVNRELMQANQKLQPLLQNCNCSNSESLCVRKDDSCVAVGNYKNPCDNQLGIEIQKAKIQSSVNQLALLTRLAKAENESSSVYEQSEKLLEIARRSRDEIDNCASPDSCAPNCQPGFGGEICGSVGVTREQVPVELKFGVEAKMQDIEIGPVRISEVGLELPKSIATPDLPALSNIEIETPDVIIEGFEVS